MASVSSSYSFNVLDTRVGIEPTYIGLANRRLTTWPTSEKTAVSRLASKIQLDLQDNLF